MEFLKAFDCGFHWDRVDARLRERHDRGLAGFEALYALGRKEQVVDALSTVLERTRQRDRLNAPVCRAR